MVMGPVETLSLILEEGREMFNPFKRKPIDWKRYDADSRRYLREFLEEQRRWSEAYRITIEAAKAQPCQS